ncbi:MAG: CRISPR-associated protein Cas6, partial [Selenomonas sp.]|nr:CRISPR-associated protein Cas6 [Selenomonas sp.]
MLGILVLRLRTERGGHYSMFPGKLLHGALFRCIAAYDPAFASELHARKMKPFTIGFFQRTDRSATAVLRAQELNEPHYAEGEELLLRLTALDENVLAALLRIPPGTV